MWWRRLRRAIRRVLYLLMDLIAVGCQLQRDRTAEKRAVDAELRSLLSLRVDSGIAAMMWIARQITPLADRALQPRRLRRMAEDGRQLRFNFGGH